LNVKKTKVGNFNKFGSNLIFQDDNSPIHRASIVKTWKDANQIKSLAWAPQSPDINIIKNAWSMLKLDLGKFNDLPSSVEILKNRVVQICTNISTTYYKI
jgi:hypothetical protein